MFTTLKKISVGFTLLTTLFSANVLAKETLNVGVDTAFVPFEFKQADKYVGFDIDLWDAIAKKMGVNYRLQPMDFSGLIPGLQSRNLDVAMAGITITPVRAQAVDFSAPYYDADLLMAVKSSATGITKFSDLAGKKVGLKQGTSGATYMKAHVKADYVEFPNIDNAYLDLQAGNIDAVVHDSPNVMYYIKVSGNGKIKATGQNDSVLPQQYGFALQKNSPYTAQVNKALADLKAEGIYAKIYKKWFDKAPK